MFNILKENISSRSFFILQARFKTKTHWAKLRKKTGPKYKALNHFDDFYGSVFGEQWPPMKEALLRKSKYVAVINNYGDEEETMKYLSNRGAHCLRDLMKIQQTFSNEYTPETESDVQSKSHTSIIDNYISRLQNDEVSGVYPQSNNVPEKIDLSNNIDKIIENKKDKEMVANRTLDEALDNAEIDQSRIIEPSMGINSEVLYQYIPATKLKGLDDWVPESLHYSYYNSKDKDFPLIIEPETEFSFPEHLKVYTYEMNSDWSMFPEPKRSQTGVFNYYPMDCSSVVAVLALCLSPGDRLLDLCSAPGGKALVALQTLLPDVVVCNDVSISRSNRTEAVFRDYLIDFGNNKWRERVVLSRVDGRNFTDDQGFDKVLVDVPCTTDRHSVNEDENNIFRPDRVKERLRIPELQTQLLVNALKLVRVGGAVVYSTCSLSPVQNDGVLHAALKHAFETYQIVAVVKDLSSPLRSLSSTLQLASGAAKPRYGQLVLPSTAANFGPAYIARLVRVK
ncbi:PREDICTED: 5-methylcytosine rRNA methyltransferase NSUN4 [Papilio polytes]|uniref:5-methylcytosine rRNA methyltransferase NSUN4 n=1 Tax=Papilio polytes TaxID=76194 RepID=UPI0006764072|nr:PREDICTED: 5-methylcytosine rRNA methyltransferase NSUN4 [Papilio polytes]